MGCTRELESGEKRAMLLKIAQQLDKGVVLATQRRRELMDWDVEADALIEEDDEDAE